jgi:hypothetical protein
MAGAASCLAHARGDDRTAALERFSRTGELDARGVTISAALLRKILDAAPHNEDGKPIFLAAAFAGATFEGDARFTGATFKGDAGFTGVTFEGDAGFGGAKFEGDAGFDGAAFEGHASFGRATFEHGAWFGRATFKRYARLAGATFLGDAWFGEAMFGDDVGFGSATFERGAWFGRAAFRGDAGFSGTAFNGGACFHEATFEHGAWFSKATFKGDAEFGEATFKGDLAPLDLVVEGTLDLDGVQFVSHTRIRTTAAMLVCRRTRFLGGVRLDVDRALVRLDDSDLSLPSLLIGPVLAGGDPAGTAAQPKLLSLQGANVAGLTLGNIDLAVCRFAGSHNLDKLRLEADTLFGTSPAVAGWERRQVIAEESAWRDARPRPGRWVAPEWPDRLASQDRPEPLSPGVVAGVYRALRKGREDAKDEPGAADFYYGEMEMRRHDHGTADSAGSRGRATRSVLFAYWLVSGYGLRAWRSLVALAVVTALLALAFYFIGFTRPPEPASYWTSLLFAFRSTISLTDSQVTLTAWGSFFQALLRITGPVLLGLTLLALRGRVKR